VARRFKYLVRVAGPPRRIPGIEAKQRADVPDDIADRWKRRDPYRHCPTSLRARIYPEITKGWTASSRHQIRVVIPNSLR